MADPIRQTHSVLRGMLRQTLLVALAGFATFAAVGFFINSSSPKQADLVQDNINDAEVLKRLSAMSAGELQQLQAQQTGFFLAEPLNTDTLKNLVILHEVQKLPAGKFYDIFSAFTKRDVSLEVGSINSDLQSGNFDGAMHHLDALLRANPELGKTVYPLLYPTLANGKAVDALAKVLASKPQWRTDFMNELAERDLTSDLSYALFSRLRKQNAAIADSEFRNLFSNLINKKQFSKAYFMWLDFLPTTDLASMKLVYDGTFDKQPRNLFFDWNFLKRPNAKITLVNRPDKTKDQIMQVAFSQDKGEFYHVYQYLNLAPGQYSLSFDAMLDGADMPAGLQWRVRCASDDSVKGQSVRFKSNAPWARQEFLFNVPDENCETQILRLESASAATLDRVYQGRMAFDNFAIETAAANDAGVTDEKTQTP